SRRAILEVLSNPSPDTGADLPGLMEEYRKAHSLQVKEVAHLFGISRVSYRLMVDKEVKIRDGNRKRIRKVLSGPPGAGRSGGSLVTDEVRERFGIFARW